MQNQRKELLGGKSSFTDNYVKFSSKLLLVSEKASVWEQIKSQQTG